MWLRFGNTQVAFAFAVLLLDILERNISYLSLSCKGHLFFSHHNEQEKASGVRKKLILIKFRVNLIKNHHSMKDLI